MAEEDAAEEEAAADGDSANAAAAVRASGFAEAGGAEDEEEDEEEEEEQEDEAAVIAEKRAPRGTLRSPSLEFDALPGIDDADEEEDEDADVACTLDSGENTGMPSSARCAICGGVIGGKMRDERRRSSCALPPPPPPSSCEFPDEGGATWLSSVDTSKSTCVSASSRRTQPSSE